MSKNRQLSWLPNAISVSRILSVPVLVILAISGAESAYATLLLLALLSDVADGWLARRWGLAVGGPPSWNISSVAVTSLRIFTSGMLCQLSGLGFGGD